MTSERATYLPGLNGIRALAASIVIFWHSDEFAYLFGLPAYGYGDTGMAGTAVTLFFVLSGFLITLLLLKEKKKFQTVDVARFYGRRILRIWPVYYVAVLLAVLVFPRLGSEQMPTHHVGLAFGLYALLLPNAAYAFDLGIRSIKPLWSVGVEEQFYLVWPWVVKKSGSLIRALCIIAIGFVALKTSLRLFENGPFYRLLRLTAIDSMAVGGIWAWMVHHNHVWLRLVYSKFTQIFCWSFLLICIVYKPLQITSLYDSELHALVFACLITTVSSNPAPLLRLENPLANFLGRISYGLYVYHMPILCILSQFFGPFFKELRPLELRLAWVILLTYVTTVMVAWLSYHFMESRFLAYKVRLAKVPSTDDRSSA